MRKLTTFLICTAFAGCFGGSPCKHCQAAEPVKLMPKPAAAPCPAGVIDCKCGCADGGACTCAIKSTAAKPLNLYRWTGTGWALVRPLAMGEGVPAGVPYVDKYVTEVQSPVLFGGGCAGGSCSSCAGGACRRR